jgi:hypothetical protein
MTKMKSSRFNLGEIPSAPMKYEEGWAAETA